MQEKETGRLTPEKAKTLEKAKEDVTKMQKMYDNLRSKHKTLENQIAEFGYGTLRVMQKAHPGLKIIIGPQVLLLKTEKSYGEFSRQADGIEFTPFR